MTNRTFMTVEEVAAELGVSKSYAYKIVKQLNDELQKRNKDRAELIETIVDYLFDQHSPELISIIAFLHNQLD